MVPDELLLFQGDRAKDLSLGETEKALDCLKSSLEVNPNQPEVVGKMKDLQEVRDNK